MQKTIKNYRQITTGNQIKMSELLITFFQTQDNSK